MNFKYYLALGHDFKTKETPEPNVKYIRVAKDFFVRKLELNNTFPALLHNCTVPVLQTCLSTLSFSSLA